MSTRQQDFACAKLCKTQIEEFEEENNDDNVNKWWARVLLVKSCTQQKS